MYGITLYIKSKYDDPFFSRKCTTFVVLKLIYGDICWAWNLPCIHKMYLPVMFCVIVRRLGHIVLYLFIIATSEVCYCFEEIADTNTVSECMGCSFFLAIIHRRKFSGMKVKEIII